MTTTTDATDTILHEDFSTLILQLYPLFQLNLQEIMSQTWRITATLHIY